MKPPSCQACPLYTRGEGWVLPEGKLTHGVLIVGEAPGEEEARLSRPFIGASGQFLNRVIGRMNDPTTGAPLQREDFMVANILQCRPPENRLTKAPYEFEALRHCSGHLRNFLQQHRSSIKAIVTLGNQPLRWFTHRWGVDDLRGYVWPSEWGPVVGTYHPSYLLRGNFHLSRIVQHDIAKALLLARGERFEKRKTYVVDPQPQEFAEWVGKYDGTSPLAFDIETPYGMKDDKLWEGDEEECVENDPSYTILRCSFSYTPFEAVSIPWMEPYIGMAKKLFSTPSWKLVHNQHFDVPRLHNAGVLFGGVVVDNMDAWHYLEPSLPMGLKWIATLLCPDMGYWKDEAHTNPGWYNAADSDVLLRCFLSTKLRLEREGRWEGFDKQFIQLRRVLDKMSFRGVYTDRAVREEGRRIFSERFDQTVESLQPLIPLDIRKKKVYKGDEAKLRKGGQWKEGMMTRLVVMEPPSKKWWWAVGLEGQPLGRVKSVTMLEAESMLKQKLGDVAFTLWDEKPPKPPKKKRRKKSDGDIPSSALGSM